MEMSAFPLGPRDNRRCLPRRTNSPR